LIALSKDSDLFICEMFSYNRQIKSHLNYRKFLEHEKELSFKKLIFTHCSDETLEKEDQLKYKIAKQGESIFI
jgi:ribonuclease BN (tRNA processing enzyme)